MLIIWMHKYETHKKLLHNYILQKLKFQDTAVEEAHSSKSKWAN